MQIFTPYAEPLRVAKVLDPKRLRSQINECKVILRAINGDSKAWKNHPVVKQFQYELLWLYNYSKCLQYYWQYLVSGEIGELFEAEHYNYQSNIMIPDFLTTDFINQHKRRLYTKDPKHYAQWAELGTSDVNVYFVNGEYVRYVNGKRI